MKALRTRSSGCRHLPERVQSPLPSPKRRWPVRSLWLWVVAGATLLVLPALLRLIPNANKGYSYSARAQVESSFSFQREGHIRLDKNPDAQTIPWLDGLPPLPQSHAPDSPKWTNSIAICAIMKDENITDVREWLTYYQWIGINHVFLTDNGSNEGDKMVAQLASEFDTSFLTLRTELKERAQLPVYAWCAEEQRHRFNWIAYFDIDEFLVLRNGGANIHDFLDAYKEEAALSVHMVLMGPSGLEARPASGGVLPYYDQCVRSATRMVKTITNTYYVSGITIHPHNFVYRASKLSVNENFTPLEPYWRRNPHLDKDKDVSCDGPDKGRNCIWTPPSGLAAGGSAERIALYHYVTKSREDFAAKTKRGSGMSTATKRDDFFNSVEHRQKHVPWCYEPRDLALLCCSSLYPSAMWDTLPPRPDFPPPAAPQQHKADTGADDDAADGLA